MEPNDNYVQNMLMFLTMHHTKKSVEDKYKEILEHIQSGANINAVDGNDNNNTLLHKAVAFGEVELLKLLLNNQANITIVNKCNKNVIQFAKSQPQNSASDEIMAILDNYSKQFPSNEESKKSKIIATKEPKPDLKYLYQKKIGTSGVSGQLYESKLLSLILFRSLKNCDIDDFYLATNINGIGALDDICFRYKLKNLTTPRVLFIQLKHKDNPNKDKMTVTDLRKYVSDFSLVKYYESYLKIKKMFKTESTDPMFNCNFEEVDCDLILYTPLKNAIDDKYKNKIIFGTNDKMKFIIGKKDSNGEIFQIRDLSLLIEPLLLRQMQVLGELLRKVIIEQSENYSYLMSNEVIKKYHVILAQTVISISDEKIEEITNEIVVKKTKEKVLETTYKKYREGRFRNDFFENKNDCISLLRETIFETVETDRQEFKSDCFFFKLPVTFGNIDLTLKGKKNQKSAEKQSRIIWLADNFCNVIEKNVNTNIIKINEDFCQVNSIKEGFIEISGGLLGLIGNLLIIDEKTSMFQFNKHIEKSKFNAYNLWQELKNRVADEDLLSSIRLDIQLDDLPLLSLNGSAQEQTMAIEFLNKLWFFTDQAKEIDVEDTLKNEIERQYKFENGNQFLLRVQSDAIFLKLHNEVQTWWKRPKSAEYLTSSCKFYEKSKDDIIESPILTVLHLVYVNKIKKRSMVFNSNAIECLEIDNFLSFTEKSILSITTNECFLTMIKIYQHFEKESSYSTVTFIDLNFIVNEGYFDIVLSELKNTKLEILVFVYQKCVSMEYLLKALKSLSHSSNKKVLILSEENLSQCLLAPLQIRLIEKTDEYNNLADLENYDELIKKWRIVFQGQEENFDKLIDNESKCLIHADILSKFVNDETIEIGKPLTNQRYEEVKEYYIQRNLCRDNEYMVNTLKDIDENLVLIVAEPGMGKSILLTHLSVKTKELDALNSTSTWIVYVNLLDYSSEFQKWKSGSIDVDKNEAIRFICKAAIKGLEKSHGNEKSLKRKREVVPFKVTIENDIINFKIFNKDSALGLELQLFAKFYSQGKVIFLFDGFDEICPHYEKEVLHLLRLLTWDSHQPNCTLKTPISSAALSLLTKPSPSCSCKIEQKLWITTRAYKNVKNALERELGKTAFSLKPLSKEQQQLYLKSYLKINFDISELTDDEMYNISDLFNYMLQILSDENKHINMARVPLYTVYVAAVDYFYSQIELCALKYKYDIKEKWNAVASALNSYGENFERQNNLHQLESIAAIPLHLSIAAEYFLDEVKDDETLHSNKWDINTKSFSLFEDFLEKKFKRIRYEEKRKVDLSNPDNEMAYEKERLDFIEKHKQFALCALFNDCDLLTILSQMQLDEIHAMITRLDTGEEKTGVIDRVVDDVPRFVHLVFAEYFAIEYICDMLLKTIKAADSQPDEGIQKNLENLWNFIMNIVLFKSGTGVRTFLDYKIKNDSPLRCWIETKPSTNIVFEIMLKQGRENRVVPEGFTSSFQVIKTSFNIVTEESFLTIQEYFLECIETSLSEDNLEDFLFMISNSLVIFIALGTHNDDLVQRLIRCVENVAGGKHKLLSLLMPTFARNILPFDLSNLDSNMMLQMLNMVKNFVPQIGLADFSNFSLTPQFRSVILDYIKLFWELITDTYVRGQGP